MYLFALAPLVLALGHQHGSPAAAAMAKVQFLVGDWKGTQTFNIGPGQTMSGLATDFAESAVGGRFIEEHLSTTLEGRKPTDTRHMLGFDPKTGHYVAYWFNDTSPTAMIFDGVLDGSKLVLTGKGGPMTLRFTYDGSMPDKLTLTFETSTGGAWQKQFTSVYTK